MPLKAVLENLEGVEDAFKGLYKEIDKKFVLDIDDTVREHPSVMALKNAYDREKEGGAEAKRKLAEAETKLKELPDDFDASKWLEYKVAVEKDKEKKDKDVANLQAMFDTRVQNLEQANAAKLAEKDAAIADLDRQLDNLVVSTELTDLLVKSNVDQDLLEAAKLVIGRKVKVVPDQATGGRKVVVETTLGDQPAKDFVRAWAETDGKRFIAKPLGVDAKGGNQGRFGPNDNPFSATFWNKTKQAHLPAEKREDYARAAGFKDYQTAVMAREPVKAT